MRRIGNIWWNVGTGSISYINVFFKNLNCFDRGTKIKIYQNTICDKFGTTLLKFNSISTLQQSLACWEAFGFILETSKNNYIILIRDMAKDKLIELSKINILQESQSKRINLYKDSILIKLKYLTNKYFLENHNIYSQKHRKKISEFDIKKWIGEYEKIISKDTTYMEMINKMEVQNND